MILSKEQTKAYDDVMLWASNPDKPYFVIKGFAGTGKTFLLSQIVRNYSGTDLFCCAPTAKAASVLMGKLENVMVTTIHALLYRPVPPSDAEMNGIKDELRFDPDNERLQELYANAVEEFKKREVMFQFEGGHLAGTNSLIIVDEGSMVNNNIREDLMNLGCRVLFVGDDGQLPPVKSADWFHAIDPDARLIEVHRQALESPIIRLSMDIRSGKLQSNQYTSDDCRIVRKKQVKVSELINCDQIITGANAERHKLNRLIRKKLKRNSDHPVKGDKLICVKNDLKTSHILYVNGAQAIAASDAIHRDEFTATMDVEYGGQLVEDLMYYRYHTENNYDKGSESLDWREISHLQQFDYAYAVTCHKSQGSEWDNVVVVDDRMFAHDKAFRRRWLYTAVTRAKQQLTLVR